MPQLVKITSELFPKLYEAFLHRDDPLSDERDWRNVFDYQWASAENYKGYALLDDGKVVGMMAMAFSERQIDGRPHRFCNLHTWWVHEDYRGHSVAMLRPLLGLQDCTVTDFTPCDRVRALLKRLGFVDLNLQMRVALPLLFPSPHAQRGSERIRFFDDIEDVNLTAPDQRIFLDHQPFRVGNMVIEDGDDYCYVLYTHVVRYRVKYCHVQYFSNKAIYAANEHAIRHALMERHGVRMVVHDARLVEDIKLSNSFLFWAPAHALYRPIEGLPQNKVDNLYSDVVMLRLATMPYLRHELREIASRLRRTVRIPTMRFSRSRPA